MPASGGDPVSATLTLAFSCNSNTQDLDKDLEASAKRVLFSRIDYEPASNYQNNVLNALKTKYIVINPKNSVNNTTNTSKLVNGVSNGSKRLENTLPVPKTTLFPSERVQLGYRDTVHVGSGMINMGYTCYLNATLQALFHVPALVNWLLSESSHQKCEQNSDFQMHPDDICCAVIKTFKCSQAKSGSVMKPVCVYNKRKAICKHLNDRTQEDAHEFMRYLLESLEKNYLSRFQNCKLDSYSKETTPINQIFGGYIRTEVACLSCKGVSTTFQHFQDLSLDIRKASTLDDALAGYFERERLPDGEDAYKCEKCNRKVPATKKFTIERPPNVLCVQLKRFSSANGKLTKQVQLPQYLDLTRFISPGLQPRQLVKYRLVSMVTHVGLSVNYGHYTAIALAANGSYYQFDDDSVRQIPLGTVLNMGAYLVLYEMEKPFVQTATRQPGATTVNNINQPVRNSTPKPTILQTSPVKRISESPNGKWSSSSGDTMRSCNNSETNGRVVNHTGSRNGDVVRSLMQGSYQGYGTTNVKSWSGNDASLTKEVQSDRDDCRKRNSDDMYNDDFDRGKTKKMKYNYDRDRNRPRYNVFQDHANKQQYWRQNKNFDHFDGYNRYNGNNRNGNNHWKPYRRHFKGKFGFKPFNRFNHRY